ncbi:MAG: FAD-dependent oxidoreductase, partial [Planctomycetota bacterium]
MPSAVRPTVTFDEALHTDWDVVVIGAGPAGSMAARGLARLGRRVLMIDRQRFPRSKVCGCCVNQAALGLLEQPERELLETEGSPLRTYRLASAGRVATVELSGGMAVSRDLLDAR